MPHHHKNLRKTADSSIRIIAGQWRGRKLKVLDEDGLRPTGNRLKETLFNWLAPVLPGTRCLDAYAGTGSLGLEALSRQADSVQFIESNAKTAIQLQQNLKVLDCHNAEVHRGSALNWLKKPSEEPFDIVFIDPPFANTLWQATIDALHQQQWLKPQALVYIESPKDTTIEVPASWRIYRQKTTGQVLVTLYETSSTEEG